MSKGGIRIETAFFKADAEFVEAKLHDDKEIILKFKTDKGFDATIRITDKSIASKLSEKLNNGAKLMVE